VSERRRFLFFLYHPGYLRHYGEPIRILARQGHSFHLAFTNMEKDAGDLRLAEQLAAEQPNVTFSPAPARAYLDGWRRTALLVRAFTDFVRYIHPRYENSTALRQRMAVKIKADVVFGKADPFTQRALTRLVDRLDAMTDMRTANRLLRFLRALERAIPTSGRINDFIRAQRPDCVVVTPLVEYASTQVEFLKSARRLEIPTVIAVASWDNLTNKGLLRFDPERVLVWNAQQREELEEMHGVSGDKAVLTGAQRYDEWFERTPTASAEELKGRVGLDPARPFLLYTCSSPFIAPNEVEFVRRWIGALRASDDPELAHIGVMVRPHPQNFKQWEGVDLCEFEDVVIHPQGGAQPDAGLARSDFFDSIHHSAAVVGVNTSAMVESAVLGKNVLTVLDPAFRATQEGTLHFHYLLRENGGFLLVARDLDEHLAQLGDVVRGGAQEEERVKEFVRAFVRPHGLDVAAAPLVAEALLGAADLPPAPPPVTPSVFLLRAALFPVTLVATASVLIGNLLHLLRRGDAGDPSLGVAEPTPR
jgi:hypothetical protein